MYILYIYIYSVVYGELYYVGELHTLGEVFSSFLLL